MRLLTFDTKHDKKVSISREFRIEILLRSKPTQSTFIRKHKNMVSYKTKHNAGNFKKKQQQQKTLILCDINTIETNDTN